MVRSRLYSLALILLFKHPFLVEGEAYEHVDDVGDEVCKGRWLHELRDECGKARAPGCCCQDVCRSFENEQVYPVRAEEYNHEAHDFSALFICAFEVPDAVAEVAV